MRHLMNETAWLVGLRLNDTFNTKQSHIETLRQ